VKLKEAEEYLSEVSQEIAESGGLRILSISCDVASSEEAVIQAFEPALRAFGPVDVLVNCAGTSIAGAFDELHTQDFERMLRVNVLGSVYPTRAVLPGMKKIVGGGRIVFVASQVAQVAIHGYSAYGASKWALRGMAEALQMEVKPYGILVSVCYPPDTDTPGYKAEMETKPSLTKQLSESGSVFSADNVAKDIVRLSSQGYFGISTGLDGWLLKQLHPGMTPINNMWEVVQQIVFSPIARIISVFYLLMWDTLCIKHKKTLDATIANVQSVNQASRRSSRGGGEKENSKKKK
jgi:3-dehydrosphinganine reductase